VTINSARYIDTLNNFLKSELRRRRLTIKPLHVWFQQDEASPHTAIVAMNVVRETFSSRLISRFGDTHWPSRSPDLTVCDSIFWEYFKSRVYETKPRTLDGLKVHSNFLDRLSSCFEQNGRHMLDVIFKT